MKNLELFPLSRNRYFRGKQLVTRDMEAEQEYFNNKRRLLNSLLHGCGVVCGLGVTVVDQTAETSGGISGTGVSVAIEPGLAIDGTGREIVVPEQVYLRLSDLDGFSDDSGLADCVYLCIEYAEAEREPMHSVLDAATVGDHYNRVEETSRFFLLYNKPEYLLTEARLMDAEALKAAYYGENLEKKLFKTRGIPVCLAKIGLIRWDTAYTVTSVESVPFQQYVMSASLSASLCEASFRALKESGYGSGQPANPAVEPHEEKTEPLFRQGMLSIEIPENIKTGGVAYSEELPHGLGTGAVSMSAGLVYGGGVVYGAHGIFDEPVGFEYALKTNEDTGTFTIGVRTLSNRTHGKLFFSWLAVRDPTASGVAALRPCLLVSPGTERLPVRGTTFFTGRAYGFTCGDIQWSVREPEGGRIGADGFYRAPNSPGVYEIIARSSENPDISGTAFVVVHEI